MRGRKSSKTDLLDKFLAEYDPVNVHLCPPIFQEVLQGLSKDDNPLLIRDLLMTCQFLYLDPYFVAERAASLYRELREKGLTIRKPNDCIIAYYTIHFKMELAHNDKDFETIAKHTPLKTYSH
ncbi:MAG: PIN domain-containing protein [Cyclobacteriaceae bacterium]|nr:PIN domain-containing protein [Cyclobacteriaceae bacterium]